MNAGSRVKLFIFIYISIYYGWLFVFEDQEWMKTLGGNVLSVVAIGIALVWLLQMIRSPHVRDRFFWKLLASGLTFYFLGECLWLLFESFWRMKIPTIGFLDIFFIAHVLFYSLAILIKFKQTRLTVQTVRLVFDMLITMTVAISFSWHFLIQHILEDVAATPFELLVTLSYPVTDLGLLLAVSTLFFGLHHSQAKKEMLFILFGLFVQIFANSIHLFFILNNGYESGNITDPLYILSALLIALAGRLYGNAPAEPETRLKSTSIIRLLIPYASVTVLFIFMIFYAGFNALTIGAAVSIILLMVRQAVTIVENRTLYDQLLQRSDQLSINEQRYRSLFDYYPEAAYSVDLDGRFQSMNRVAASLLGFSNETEAIGLLSTSFVADEDKERIMAHYPFLFNGEAREFEVTLRSQTGQQFIINITNIPIVVDGRVTGIYGIGKDITEQKNKQRQMKHLAYHDGLTGLPNRLSFEKKLMKLVQDNQKAFAILYMDLDGFKKINDTLGHDAGDDLLVSVSSRLLSSIRTGDMASRQGGDEFAILLSEFSKLEEVQDVAMRLLGLISQPHHVAGQALFLTPSIGISVYPDNGYSPEQLIKKADMAMYDVKQNGKGAYRFYFEHEKENV